jgi:hypothetical protein
MQLSKLVIAVAAIAAAGAVNGTSVSGIVGENIDIVRPPPLAVARADLRDPVYKPPETAARADPHIIPTDAAALSRAKLRASLEDIGVNDPYAQEHFISELIDAAGDLIQAYVDTKKQQ